MKLKYTVMVLGTALSLGTLSACSTTEVAQAEQVQKSQPSEFTRVLALKGGRNFRDLGGYQTTDGHTVKWGKIYRSGALHQLTDADYQKLKGLEIATIVDFRATHERQKEVTNWQAGPVNQMAWDYNLDVDTKAFAELFKKGEVTAQDMENVMANMYPGILDSQKPHYQAMFAQLVKSDEPLLFHCTAGKDRTGIAAALILTALGVDRATIEQDYVLTESVLKMDLIHGMTEEQKKDPMYAAFARLPKPALEALSGARPSYIRAAFAKMESEAGSVENYIKQELNVTDAQIAQLRANFLE
ncbi:tyrosine-protein phosphatase [Catenovulum sp. 2E275]|uniref:tyrosine-protein phosphatase n=1 Tax=Catenovulum sp. 2E275 TaxID=2980497 RepID=UPI0021CF4A27|nr:tyrosine-protein phosphatase [Catenovulum sp. 2E275]MCU4675121.1 tyrosine-protein phosphatase [Catenovulum sp. 2E275]